MAPVIHGVDLPSDRSRDPAKSAPMLRADSRHVSPVPSSFSYFRKNTARILTTFSGSDHYQELEAKLEREQGNKVWEQIRIDINRFNGDVKQVLTPSELIHTNSVDRLKWMRPWTISC